MAIVVLFGFGFYFGYKKAEVDASGGVSGIENIAKQVEADISDNNGEAIDFKEIEAVYWIPVGSEPNCPVNYPIKAKLGSEVNVFYTKENKFYDRVKPSLCFANAAYARETAGFIQKF